MSRRRSLRLLPSLFVLTLCGLFWANAALALPAFARQTGVACAGCHVGSFGPQLTALGRQFKEGGYTLSNGQSGHVPLSGMLVGSYTRTSKDLTEDAGPHDGTNNNVSLQEASLFIAGKLTDHIGAFSQITYSDIERKVGLDNVDVRYAKPFTHGKHRGVFGVSVNNNPGISDPWHTLGVWRFPFISSEFSPGPITAPLIDEGLGQQVVGADAYAQVDSRWYASLGLYKSLSRSLVSDINADYGGRISGAAPYWRFSWQPELVGQSLEVGTFGLDARLQPDGSANPTDHYRDYGLDVAYERSVNDGDEFTLSGNFTHENNRLESAYLAGEADMANHTLDSTNINATYEFKNTYGLTLDLFNVSGSRDASLYAPEPDFGSGNGSPSSRGEIIQGDWTPFGKADSWHKPNVNLRLGMQYTHFDHLNGASSNYDGFGRNSGSSDTLFVFAWLAI